MPHSVSASLLVRSVNIHVVGCGGTGSAIIPGLAKIHRAMLALGHEHGLHVTVWDNDEVSLHNCIRQNFFECDAGHPKAVVMVNRMNIAHAPARVHWTAKAERFSSERLKYEKIDFVIGCVDTKQSRKDIAEMVNAQDHALYWIDCGNESSSGQIVIGQGGKAAQNLPNKLPLVTELLPEIITGDESATPSCSAMQSIMRQGVLTNQMAATWALAWIDQALRHGTVDWNAVFFNLQAGRVTAISAEPSAWEKMGYSPARQVEEPMDT